MALPDNINPQYVLDKSIQGEIDTLQRNGEVAIQSWSKDARPASGWTPESYWQARTAGAAVTPEFPGAQSRATAPGGWMDVAQQTIGQAEGFSGYAYHGVYSEMRKTQGTLVKDAHGSKEEVSVGFGFNMNRSGARESFRAAGLSDEDFDAVFNGRKALTKDQALRLRENDILQTNAGIERSLGGRPLRDHQRAALVSLAYNTGLGGAKGVFDLIKAGASDNEVATFITNFKTGRDGKLGNRRRHEASMWLGAKAQDHFAGNVNQL